MTENENKGPENQENESEQQAASPKKDEAGVSYVSLVADPFGYKNLEIASEQDNLEPLTLDEPLDEETTLEAAAGEAQESSEDHEEDEHEEEFVAAPDNGTLDKLAEVIQDETEKNRVEAEELVAQAAQALAEWTPDAETQAALESADKLAKEIAEDQALQAHLQQEAEEAEKMDPELLAALPQKDENGNLDLNELQSAIEAILFMVDKPMSMDRIRELLGPDFELNLFQEAMSALMDRYQTTAHGIELIQVANGYQFRTKAGRAALSKKLAKVQTQRLSSGAMETLAIVAYKQPVLKDDIDKIRGVDSSYFIRQLLDKKLIEMTGRSEMVGRPLLYGTTNDFLSLFNLKDLSAMPSLREIEQMIPTSQSQNPDDEDPRVKEMRKLVGQMKSDTSVSLIYDAREDDKILKDIKDRVGAIATSTPYLDQQKEMEKQTAEAAKHGLTLEEWLAKKQAELEAKEAAKAGASAEGEEAAGTEAAHEAGEIPPEMLQDSSAMDEHKPDSL